MGKLANGLFKACFTCCAEKPLAEETTLADENKRDGTITRRDGTIIRRDGTIINRDGTLTLRDGTITRRDGTIIRREGTITRRDGTILNRDGTITNRDGTITYPTIRRPTTLRKSCPTCGGDKPEAEETTIADGNRGDGPITRRDGTITNPDGTITKRDGTITNRDGTITSRDGTITNRDGTITNRDGTITTPTIIKPTIIKPTIKPTIIKPTPIDEHRIPSKTRSLMLPPETTTPTITETTIIKPTVIDEHPNPSKAPLVPPETTTPTITKPTPSDEHPNPSKAPLVPPETTTPTITKPTIIKPTPSDEHPSPSKAPLLPPETTTPTITKPTIIKPTPSDEHPSPSKAPSLPPDTTDVPGSSKQGTTLSPEFEIDCLNEHNRLRALHGCPPLKLNPKLNATSKDWAIHMANTHSMKNNKECTYGENLYMSHGFTLHGSKPVQSWYKEIKDYNYQKPGFRPETGHFTQVIWKDSKELGVGVHIRDNTTWVVAHYNPPGNVQFMFAENVPRIVRMN